MNCPTPLAVVAFLLLGTAHATAQDPPPAGDGEDILKAAKKDPFTGAEPKAMAAAGVTAYGSMMWAGGFRTDDVDKVLGPGRVMWLETAHFRIGYNLATAAPPEDPEARKGLGVDLGRMKKRHPRFPERAGKLEPWLRLHLYAHRAEEMYAEVAALVGHDDKSGTFLGQQDKFALALFQKKSDLARYLDRFCGQKGDDGRRVHFASTGQHGIAMAAEGDEPRDEAQVHSLFRNLLAGALLDAGGDTPYWLKCGYAHVEDRKSPSRFLVVAIKDDDHVDAETQHKWHAKMKGRVRHAELLTPIAELATMYDFGYWHHLQAWSRVDYLLTTDRAKFGELLRALRGGNSFNATAQFEALRTTYGMEPADFDARWREWVAKTYK
ncbi:MAG: hypothetical protein ACK6D1_13045 [Planctomycetota bacterium]